VYCLDGGEPPQGAEYEPDEMDELRGTTIAALPAFYDFVPHEGGGTRSSGMAAAGLVLDQRVASITYTRPGAADVSASISNGTFVLAAPLGDHLAGGRVVVRDAGGVVLETVTPRDTP